MVPIHHIVYYFGGNEILLFKKNLPVSLCNIDYTTFGSKTINIVRNNNIIFVENKSLALFAAVISSDIVIKIAKVLRL